MAKCPFCGEEAKYFIQFNGTVVGCEHCGVRKKETNADRLRSMTDEELARFLMRPTRFIPKWNCYATCKHACEECVLEWLRKEADDE